MKNVIVIPIHSNQPSSYELISFLQCFTIVKDIPIVVVCPRGLDLSQYRSVVPRFKVEYFAQKWFSTKQEYNKLKLSLIFYSKFKQYDNLITYELDAFIFKNDLKDWCSLGLDYIGAPWVEEDPTFGVSVIGVGNSGFSIRKVSSMIAFLKAYKQFPSSPPSSIIDRIKIKIILWLTPLWIWRDNLSIQFIFDSHEDLLIASKAPIVLPHFKIASPEQALGFSWECLPSLIMKQRSIIPTGCHAWWRYDLNFWKPYIEQAGHSI